MREAAGWRCTWCGVPDRAWGWRDASGAFHQLDRALFHPVFRPPFTYGPWDQLGSPPALVRVIEIVLTVAHLDHAPENCAPENLAALCQRCHLNHDRPQHMALQAARRREAMATPDLLEHFDAAA